MEAPHFYFSVKELNIKELVGDAIRGSEEAFALLYNEYFTPIYRFIFFRVKNRADAEDLTQNVFLKAYSSISGFEERGVPFLAWLYTIARNATIDYWKKKKDKVSETPEMISEELEDDKNSTQREMNRLDTRSAVIDAIRKLSPEQQEVIILRHLEERSYAEISALLGKSEEALRALNSRAGKILKKLLKDY